PQAAGVSDRFAIGQILGAFVRETETGLRVTNLGGEESAAQKAGLEEADIIKGIDSKEVDTTEKLLEELRSKKPEDKVTLTVEREREGQKETKQLALTIEEARGGGPGTRSRTRPNGGNYGGQQSNIQHHQGDNGAEFGGLYRSADAG